MSRLTMKLLGLRRAESGATAVEYALMVAFIAIAIIAAVVLLGNSLSSIFVNASVQI